MPDKAIVPAFDQCTACALASENGSAQGSLPTSHAEVCCLYKFARHEQAVCFKHPWQSLAGKTPCGGVCEGCPSRLSFPQPRRDAAQEGTSTPRHGLAEDSPRQRPGTSTPRKEPAQVSPRQRRGFSNHIFEIRPPKFKRKLWLGTYEEEDIDRAKDGINYYLCRNKPYILADSPLLFAQHQLGIAFQDLEPSCKQFLLVDEKRVRASLHFARRVRDAIKTVTGKKNKRQRRQLRKLEKGTPAATPTTPTARTRRKAVARKPRSPCAPHSPQTLKPAASEPPISSVGNDIVWDTALDVADYNGAASSEAISALATEHPQRAAAQFEFQFGDGCDLQELQRVWDGTPLDDFPLDETDPQDWMDSILNADLDSCVAPETGAEDASFSFSFLS